MNEDQWSFRTRAIHVGQANDPATGAVVPPLHVASTFVQHHAGEWREFDYSRSGNPTRKAFETTLASLEGGCGALAFASGMAATHCVTMLLEARDHILAGADIYGGTYRLLHKTCSRSGIGVTLVDTTDLAALDDVFTPKTKLALDVSVAATNFSDEPPVFGPLVAEAPSLSRGVEVHTLIATRGRTEVIT